MRYLIPLLMMFLATTTGVARAQTIPPSESPAECDAIVAPSRADLEPWLAGSAWTTAARYYVKGQYARAADAFAEGWKALAAELAGSFGTMECDYESVNRTLDGRVFKAPPDVIPMDEDFALPLIVAMAAADSACRSGDIKRAARWLAPAAASGKPDALAAMIVLESSWAPAVAVERIQAGEDRLPLELMLAGCVASIREGKPRTSWCDSVNAVCDGRQCLGIKGLAGTLLEGSQGRSQAEE